MTGRVPAGVPFIPPAAFGAGLLVLAVVPVAGFDEAPGWTDAAAHAGLYGLLCLLVIRACSEVGARRPLLAAFVITVVYGAATELVQMLVPYRNASAGDVAADALGAGLACLLAAAVGHSSSLPSPDRDRARR